MAVVQLLLPPFTGESVGSNVFGEKPVYFGDEPLRRVHGGCKKSSGGGEASSAFDAG